MRKLLLILPFLLLLPSGCKEKPKTDYSALEQSGMWPATLDQIKQMKPSDSEIAQLAALKQVGATDDFCFALFNEARNHGHDFTSGKSAVSLSRAGYSDQQILDMAKADKIDILSDDAVTLKLLGLSNSTVQLVIQRRVQGIPTLTSAQIGRLKNTGMSEHAIVELINQGLAGQQADEKIAKLESTRDHSHTGFVRVRGRRAR